MDLSLFATGSYRSERDASRGRISRLCWSQPGSVSRHGCFLLTRFQFLDSWRALTRSMTWIALRTGTLLTDGLLSSCGSLLSAGILHVHDAPVCFGLLKIDDSLRLTTMTRTWCQSKATLHRPTWRLCWIDVVCSLSRRGRSLSPIYAGELSWRLSIKSLARSMQKCGAKLCNRD
jgi:hypothetical protein